LIRSREGEESSDIIVTAGHCVTQLGTLNPGSRPQPVSPSAITITAGNHNIHTNEQYEVSEIGSSLRMHSDFGADSNGGAENDIAVIKLKRPIKFNDAIRPICLPSQGAPIPSGKTCVVVGWGRDSSQNSGSFPSTLQQLYLPVHPAGTCQRSWSSSYKENQMICAGSLNGDSGSCQGDSGGPLACKESDGRWTLHGVVSWGMGGGCLAPNKPSVYTRVSSYASWITQQMTSMKRQ